MATIVPTFYTRLSTDSGVSALVASRLYPEYVRQSDTTYPLAVFKVENETSQLASDGPTGLYSADFVIAAVSPSYKTSAQVADAIQTSLDGAAFTDVGNNLRVQGCFAKEDGRTETVETQQDNEAMDLYIVEQTFLVWFASTI